MFSLVELVAKLRKSAWSYYFPAVEGGFYESADCEIEVSPEKVTFRTVDMVGKECVSVLANGCIEWVSPETPA